MKNIICIYAQRCDDNTVWDEAVLSEDGYTGNTIAVSTTPDDGLSYDFSGCGSLSAEALDAFFSMIGVEMGQGAHAEERPSIFNLMTGNPSLN